MIVCVRVVCKLLVPTTAVGKSECDLYKLVFAADGGSISPDEEGQLIRCWQVPDQDRAVINSLDSEQG